MIVLKNAKVITPFRTLKCTDLYVDGSRISRITPSGDKAPDGAKVIDCKNRIVCPGYIDLHTHGAGGADYNDASLQAFETASHSLMKCGTTGVLATVYPKQKDELLNNIAKLVEFCANHETLNNIFGIHLEGPFLNPMFKGAMNENMLWETTYENWKDLYYVGGDFIKLMTIAPEIPGAMKIIHSASMRGVIPSIGHSDATYEEMLTAVDFGAAQVSHVFNAMRPIHHRDPRVLVGALVIHELKTQVIADCIHIDPAVLRMIYQIKGASGIILVSDSIRATGCKDGKYPSAGLTITVKGRKAYLPDGTLAGSTLTLDEAVRNMHKMVNVPLEEAIRMATLNPARVVRIDHKKGIIAVGKDADLLVLNKDLKVLYTIIGGKIAYSKDKDKKD